MPQRFRIPPVIQYFGSRDPSEHVEAYCSWMQIHIAMDVMMYQEFSITLKGSAWSWYRQLKPNSISSFAELSRLFLTQFISGKRSRKPNTHLFAIKQEPNESLKGYIARFNEEALLIEDYAAVFNGLREGKFAFSIGKNPPKTLAELVARAQKYTNAEEFSNACKNVQVPKMNDKGKRPRNGEAQPSSKGTNDRAPRDRRPNRRTEGKFHSDTPLNAYAEQMLLDIRREKLLNWPVCMKADSDHRDKRKYYRFHRDHCHNTADCVDLKDEIEALIRKGHLRRYTKEGKAARKEGRERERPNNITEEPAEIRTIFRGLSSGGDSNRARKAHSRKPNLEHYVHLTEQPSKELRVSPCTLTFTEEDARGIQHPHDDALVVTMTIANRKVYRILVDTGSSADMMYSEAFERMEILRSHLRHVKTPLHDFAVERVISEGAISLPVTAGKG
ncbi:uncharacterized protein LOC131254882 [Magnolia sinica]|uniref:uncharacterized protein LOC131254882 n=1 Tax=Magnolia sinica TaxID=86752 RepID=UPI00265A8C8F|nr:uncharacterized protein LOC131254882 [Magnolia sinica]